MLSRRMLLRNSRTTDSPGPEGTPAKSAEFPFRLAPQPAACALLISVAIALVATPLPAQAPHRNTFVIVLIGPTGSGKTTQAEFLKRKYGVPIVTADDLIQQNPGVMAKYRTPGIDPGVPQSSPALNELVSKRLSKPDVGKGFVLDGYPATKDQADHLSALLEKLGLPKPVIIQLDVPDDTDRTRLKKRKREDDTPQQIERRLKDYHREMDMIHAYYPEENIWTIDGTLPPADVSKTIVSILNDELPKKRSGGNL